MKTLLRLSAVLLLSALAVNAYPSTPSATYLSGIRGATLTTSTPTYGANSVQMMNTQSLNTQSLSMYGASSQLMHGNYSVPMAAKFIGGGEILEEEEEPCYGPRRRALGGDTYRPGYDPNDPFHTPLGEVPVLLIIILAAMVTYLRSRKLKAAALTATLPTAEESQEA